MLTSRNFDALPDRKGLKLFTIARWLHFPRWTPACAGAQVC